MLTYAIDEIRSFIVTDEAYGKLLTFVQIGDANERGGVLLGKVTQDYKTVFVTDISTPSKADKSGRYYFIRSNRPAQKKINEEWEKSNGEVNYIGEWHTHPVAHLIPSADDKDLLYKNLHINECPFDELFMIIIGIDGSLYVGYWDKKKFKELKRKE